jgi:hypothetical protein
MVTVSLPPGAPLRLEPSCVALKLDFHGTFGSSGSRGSTIYASTWAWASSPSPSVSVHSLGRCQGREEVDLLPWCVTARWLQRPFLEKDLLYRQPENSPDRRVDVSSPLDYGCLSSELRVVRWLELNENTNTQVAQVAQVALHSLDIGPFDGTRRPRLRSGVDEDSSGRRLDIPQASSHHLVRDMELGMDVGRHALQVPCAGKKGISQRRVRTVDLQINSLTLYQLS